MGRIYRVREFAALAGVTVRTLHYYDRLGLLQPRRTAAEYRRYSQADLEQLEKITALKFLGFSLKQVRDLLAREDRELVEVLRSQRCTLEAKRSGLEAAIRAIQEAEQLLAKQSSPDPEPLRKIIEVITVENNREFLMKYYSEGARTMLEQREAWSPELQAEISESWAQLFRDVEAALNEDPASETAQKLGARWTALVERFTGGDPEVSAGVGQAWADHEHWPASLQQQTVDLRNRKVWEFITKAMSYQAKS